MNDYCHYNFYLVLCKCCHEENVPNDTKKDYSCYVNTLIQLSFFANYTFYTLFLFLKFKHLGYK